MSETTVAITRTAPKPGRASVAAAVRRAVELAGGLPAVIASGKIVLLKPNMVALPRTRQSGAVTHPEVCRAVAEIVRERGAVPIVADSAGIGADTEAVIDFMGYNALRRDGFPVIDLKKEKAVRVKCGGARILKSAFVYEPALRADAIINLPVLKTHDQTEVTLSLKNLKGLLADCSKAAMHRRGLYRGIVELASFIRPCFTVLDGIYCQEGVGPVFGDPVEMDLIFAATDMVALDAVAGLVIGYGPDEVPVTSLAAESGLGLADPDAITVKGESWKSIHRPFKRSSHSAILNELLPCRLQLGGDTCSGCRNTVISVLVELKEREMLHLLKGRTIVTGRPPLNLGPDGLLLVGSCTRRLRRKGTYIEGCPPENSCIIKDL